MVLIKNPTFIAKREPLDSRAPPIPHLTGLPAFALLSAASLYLLKMRCGILLAAAALLGAAHADVGPTEKPAEQGTACGTPSKFEISKFVLYTDNADSTKSSTSFHYSDSETQIDTDCERNSTSVADAPGGSAERYKCQDMRVEFIYEDNDPTGRITMVEASCPEG